MARLPDPARSRAVLVGSAQYRNLPDLPAVAANLVAVRDVLTDRVSGGFAFNSCTVLPDPPEPRQVWTVLREQARNTGDTFLVYFAGHGLLGGPRNDLYLALAETDTDDLVYTALAYDQVRDVLLDCPARNRVVILDCCFAGAALSAMADPAAAVAGQTVVKGGYVLAAAPATRTALAPLGARHTAFTGALLEHLATGIPDGPELFTLAELYPRLRATLTSRGLPQPRQQGTDTVTGLALTRNPACQTPTTPRAHSTRRQPSSGTESNRDSVRRSVPLRRRPSTRHVPALAVAAAVAIIGIAVAFPVYRGLSAPDAPTPTTTVPSSAPAASRFIGTLNAHADAVESVAWAPDGKTLATGGSDGEVRIWDPATGKTLRTLTGHTEAVFTVAWAPDGNTLATASKDRTVRIWDLATGQ